MMIRKHESDVSWKAGMLALAVHAVLFVAMVVSINWKAAHPPMNITEVELWDNLPTKVAKPVAVKPPPPPEIKEAPKPVEPNPVEPPPKPVEEKPEPAPPKVDVELENKKKEQDKKVAEKKKAEAEKRAADEKIKMLQKKILDEELKPKKEDSIDPSKLKELQDAMLDDKPASAQQASTVPPSLISEFTEKIKAKIRGNVNKTLCGDGNPELRFDISLLLTGDLSGPPKLVKSSGNAACDDAVERAIMASEPFPLPEDAAAKAQFKNLKLKFKPNNE
jgi:colicin import membrane protein